jgi:hypothetical protein
MDIEEAGLAMAKVAITDAIDSLSISELEALINEWDSTMVLMKEYAEAIQAQRDAEDDDGSTS